MIRRSIVVAVLAIAVAIFAAAPAGASRDPTPSEAKAIKRAFLKGREGKTTIQKIRVSTVDPRFAAVFYTIRIEELQVKSTKKYKPPSPAILKEGKGGKWKPASKVPKKVKKDLKDAPKSNIRISGDVGATLTRPASCTQSKGFYSASVYDRAADIYLSIEINRYTGPHEYPALSVRSVATLAVGNNAGTPQWETGQAHDAFASSGEIWVDEGRWGIIEAGMARTPPDESTESNTVVVSGFWDCR
jgi:hypothetical protein